jgi:hypothetical protein
MVRRQSLLPAELKASRTNNAPEILEILHEWENSGVEAQTTEPYTSSENELAERSIQYSIVEEGVR